MIAAQPLVVLRIENSPALQLPPEQALGQAPLIMLHNDADDAVPWYQGIEFFLALRRLGKEVYLFNYNGEFHGLRRRHNQRDWTVRMAQFFDHHLKGAPKPEWMEKGVPYIDREAEKQRFRQTGATIAFLGDPRSPIVDPKGIPVPWIAAH